MKLDGTDVEALRSAADLLDGTADQLGYSAATLTEVRLLVSLHLRLLAQRHCEHARVTPDGDCRYCGAPVEQGHAPMPTPTPDDGEQP